MSPVYDLSPDLLPIAPEADAAEIGRPVASKANNAMALLAPRPREKRGALPTGVSV